MIPTVKPIYGLKALWKLSQGAKKAALPTLHTLGPKGPNTAMRNPENKAVTTNDGFAIAQRLKLEDPYEDIAREISVESSIETNKKDGDGTTTTLLLNWRLVWESFKLIVFKNKNPLVLRNEIRDAKDIVLYDLYKNRTKVDTDELREYVAHISSQDEETGKLVASATKEAGEYGSVMVQESPIQGIKKEKSEGMTIDSPIASHSLIRDPLNQDRVSFTDPLILVTGQTLNLPSEVLPSFASAIQTKRPLLIVAKDFSKVVMQLMTENNDAKVLDVCAVKLTDLDIYQEDILQDIAYACGAKYISKDSGLNLASIGREDTDEFAREYLGTVRKAVIGEKDTQLLGLDEGVKERIEYLSKEAKKLKDGGKKERLEKRLAKLSGGLVVINIGAKTHSELFEKKLRLEDAINATKVAVEHGAVAGGGIALLNARKSIEHIDQDGARVLHKVLAEPFKRILKNAGYDYRRCIEDIEARTNYGMDASTGDFGDMYKLGIIDPHNVVKDALDHAVSSSMSIISTSCVIAETKND